MDLVVVIAAAVFPVFAIALIGYLWTKSGNFLDPKSITPLVSDVAVPCLAFATIAQMDIPLQQAAKSASAAVVVMALTGIAAWALLKLLRLDVRTFLSALTFSNAGNLGLSLSASTFGPAGLGFGLIFFALSSIANNTIGRAIAAGEGNWRRALQTPILPALALGLAVKIFHLPVPAFIMKTATMIAAIAIPLMLFMLGASLATIKLRVFWRPFMLSCVRIALGIVIGFAVAALFGLTGAQRATLILQSAMPAAVLNYLFAQLWDNEPAEIAGIIVISTLLSVVTTPLLLAVLLAL